MDVRPEHATDHRIFERYLRRPGRPRLERVVKHFHKHVWRTALRLSGSEDDAADVAQDLFLALLLEPPAAGSVRSPRGYLTYRVLTLARRRERSERRRRLRESRAAKQILESPDASDTDVEAVREAIARLPDPLRSAVELRYLGHFTNREIADALGVSERSIEDYLRRAREKLRGRLGRILLGPLVLAPGVEPSDSPAAASTRALEHALRVVRHGRALAPLSGGAAAALSTAAIAGGVAVKKIVAVAIALALLMSLAVWTVLSTPELPTEVAESAREDAPPVASAPAAAPRTEPGAEVAAKPAIESPPAPGPAVCHARISGRVIDDQSRPVAGASIAACATPLQIFRGREPEPLGETTSDAEGRFVLEGIRAGTFSVSLTASKQDFATAQTVAYPSPSSLDVGGVLLVLEHGTASIRGRVVDESGEPIAGARVWPAAFTTAFGLRQFGMLAAGGAGFVASDADGRFVVDGLRASIPFDVTVTHPRYRRAALRHIVPDGDGLEIELASGLRFAGRVVATSNEPVANAPITLRSAAPSRWGAGVHHEVTTSGSDGAFELLAVPADTYVLSIDPPFDFLVPPEATLELDESVDKFTITLATDARVAGFARDESTGDALPGVALTVVSRGVSRLIESDASGAFRCAVDAGDVLVTPNHDARGRFVPLEGGELSGSVAAGDTLAGDVLFTRAEDAARDVRSPVVSGRVVDAEGDPVVALVSLSDVVKGSGFSGRQRSTQSNELGEFSLNDLPSLPARLIAANPRLRLGGQRVISDASEVVDITLRLTPYPETRIDGVVVDARGASIPGAAVLLTRSGRELDGAAQCVRAGADGRFAMESLLPDTYYSFTPVVDSRHGPWVSHRVRSGERNEVEIVFPDIDATISGTVTDRGGAPIRGLHVVLDPTQIWGGGEEIAITDRFGRFEKSVMPGGYHVRIDEHGFGFWSANTEAPAAFQITLERTRMVSFRVLDPDGLPVTSLRVSGKVQGHGPHQRLTSASGEYEVEIQENETELEIASWRHEPRRVELNWPAAGPLDLGTIELDGPESREDQ